METLKNNLSLLLTIGAAATMLYGYAVTVDARYAKASQLTVLQQRVELNSLRDLLRDALEEMYFYRKQQRKYPDDQEVAQRLKEAEEEVAKLKKRIEELEK